MDEGVIVFCTLYRREELQYLKLWSILDVGINSLVCFIVLYTYCLLLLIIIDFCLLLFVVDRFWLLIYCCFLPCMIASLYARNVSCWLFIVVCCYLIFDCYWFLFAICCLLCMVGSMLVCLYRYALVQGLS